jgi:hypothetical protein
MPVNTNQLFPLPIGDNVVLPALNFAQCLSHYAGVIAGRLDISSVADANEFAHGKGDTQRGNGRAGIFEKPADCAAFESVMIETLYLVPMRLLAFGLMPKVSRFPFTPPAGVDIITGR